MPQTPKPVGDKAALSADEQPPAAEAKEAAEKSETADAESEGSKETISAHEHPPKKAADQTDDLLFPTEDERRAIEASIKHAEKAAQPEEAGSDKEVGEPRNRCRGHDEHRKQSGS